MFLSSQDIIGLPVFTKSQDYLGKVASFDVSVESQQIERYYVKSSHPFKRLWKKVLLIHTGQVISINRSKMVVEDISLPSEVLAKEEVENAVPLQP